MLPAHRLDQAELLSWLQANMPGRVVSHPALRDIDFSKRTPVQGLYGCLAALHRVDVGRFWLARWLRRAPGVVLEQTVSSFPNGGNARHGQAHGLVTEAPANTRRIRHRPRRLRSGQPDVGPGQA